MRLWRSELQILSSWFKQRNRKPLILRGARQVGKSTLVRDFARNQELQLYEVNLERHPGLEKIIATSDPKKFLDEVAFLSKQPLPEAAKQANCLIFIDEIQAVPAALGLIRYIAEEYPKLAVIAAGSLLEFALEETNFSMPVGRIDYLYIGPLRFDDFLKNLGEEELYKLIKEWVPEQNFPESAHQLAKDRLREYLHVGGMPEPLSSFIQDKDLSVVSQIHGSLTATYRDDFSKYASSGMVKRIQKIFDYQAIGIGKKVKFSNIDRDERAADLHQAVKLLAQAQVITLAFHANGGSIPLRSFIDERIFKLYAVDCGVYNYLVGAFQIPPSSFSSEKLNNFGTILEQFSAQHLAYKLQWWQKPELFYWLREGKQDNAEVDFLLEIRGAVVPVEIKSGAAGRLRSLQEFIVRNKANCAIRLNLEPPNLDVIKPITGTSKSEVSCKLLSLPCYMVGEIERICSSDAGIL